MFDFAMDFVEAWEGGWSNDRADPGGLTKWGVTIGTLMGLRLDFNRDGRVDSADLAAMTKPEARELYRRHYWDRTRCEDLPPAVALLVFDAAVNQGPARASRFLQTAAGAHPDGIIGPRTMAAVALAARTRPADFLLELAAQRAVHYASLPHFGRFGRGWSRRLLDCYGTAADLPMGMPPAAA